jgi:hypothetical protein
MTERPDANKKDVAPSCLLLLLNLDISGGSPEATARLEAMIADTKNGAEDLQQVPCLLRRTLTLGDPDVPDQQQDRVRKRAFQILEQIADRATGALEDLIGEIEEVSLSDSPHDELERVRDRAKPIAQLVDAVSSEMYFGSGAYAMKNRNAAATAADDSSESFSDAVRNRFFKEAGPLLSKIALAPIPSATHHFLETLEFLMPANPRAALVLMADAVKAGSRTGYQRDSLAEGVIAEIANTYIGEYRDLLEADPAARTALLDILDVFAEAGWPSIRHLLLRLDEIYR